MAKQHSDRAHALLSPSSASRWLACPPSARLEDAEPQSGSVNDYAAEGTLAHELAELELRMNLGQLDFGDYKLKFLELSKSKYFSDSMVEEVDKYVSYVLEIIEICKEKTEDTVVLIEEKVDLTEFVPEGFGSNDSIIIADGVMYVNDLKFGKGVKVSANDNKQLKLYALGSFVKYNILYGIELVVLSIIQPRLNHAERFEITADELLRWGDTVVKPGAALAFEGKGELNPGEHCRFCKVSHKCKGLAKKNLELAKHEFKDPYLLSDDELLEISQQADMLTNWVNSVQDYLLKSALSGKEFKGFKLVEGRSNRVITNPEIIADVLLLDFEEDLIFNKKLKGIGELEKLLGKTQFNELVGPYVVKPQGKPTLVLDTDPRPKFNLNTAASDFADD